MTDTKDIDSIAKLARLRVNEADKAAFAKQMTFIMEMIDSLKEVECDGVEPLRSVVGATQHLRKDIIDDGNIAEALFQNAPGAQSSLAKDVQCFVVPKVVE